MRGEGHGLTGREITVLPPFGSRIEICDFKIYGVPLAPNLQKEIQFPGSAPRELPAQITSGNGFAHRNEVYQQS